MTEQEIDKLIEFIWMEIIWERERENKKIREYSSRIKCWINK